jgi:hypothetical protein
MRLIWFKFSCRVALVLQAPLPPASSLQVRNLRNLEKVSASALVESRTGCGAIEFGARRERKAVAAGFLLSGVVTADDAEMMG